jgi:hypothetical protein
MAVCVGNCFEVVDGVLQLQIDPAGGLTCGGAGLAVSETTLDPISPDACNGIVRRGNGLYAPCPQASANAHLWNPGAITPFTMSTGGDATFRWPSDSATIANTACCNVGGRVSVRFGGLRVLAHNGFHAEAHLDVNINGGGFGAATPDTTLIIENHQGVDVNVALNGFLDENYLVVGGSTSQTYAGQLTVVVIAGTGDVSGTPQCEINWVLPQVGCC